MSDAASSSAVEMSRFFDERASSYDDHMRQSVASFERFYTLVSRPIRETRDSISVLDLGCGTGLELESVFKKAPNARITGIDLSANMLSELERKYAGFKGQITLVNASYKNVAFPEGSYDYAISVMSFHHYLHVRKRPLSYRHPFFGGNANPAPFGSRICRGGSSLARGRGGDSRRG